jgi:cation diffusion facilitator family transporter
MLHDARETTGRGLRALLVSLVGLLLTTAFQAAIALLGGSAGLLAETIHNLADAFTALPLGLAFLLARREANLRFTYGYGRAEDVAGAVVVLLIVVSAGLSAYESTIKLTRAETPRYLEWGMLAAAVGIVGNEIVARYKIRVGKDIGSAALVADGQHSRADGLTSLAALLGLLGARLGWPPADGMAGLLITLFILGIVWETGRDILSRLMDSVEPGLVAQMESVAAGVPGVREVHALRARWVGHQLTMEVNICADGSLSLIAGHQIAEEVRHTLLHSIPRLNDVAVHVDPVESQPGEFHQTTRHHESLDSG